MTRFTCLARLIAASLLTLLPAAAQKTSTQEILAAHPPMGWNSWDSYGLTITEPQFRDNVEVLAKTLKPVGWNYAVIDEGWFLRNPQAHGNHEKFAYEIDANGRYIPVSARFPSALVNGKNAGLAPIAAEVHAKGLKFGIHIIRGIPRESVAQNLPIASSKFRAQQAANTADACPWNPDNWGVNDTPAGQAWYDSLLAQYASWGVDYLKVDCISDHPYRPAEIRMIHRAILKTGRPIILSLSPGPTSIGIAEELIPYAQMWRISDDVWDLWTNANSWPQSLYDQFAVAASWVPYTKPGTWPDADMLPLGYLGPNPGDGKPRDTRLSHDEQQTLITLWSMARSPLILGANLTRLDDWTTKLLTNRDVLDVDQLSHDQRQVAREGRSIAWTSSGKGDTRYLALFNLDNKETTIDHTYDFYNLPAKSYRSRELWSQQNRGTSTSVHVTIPPHGCILLELKP